MEEWVNMLSDIGFPIAVSFYLLHRVETKLEAIHQALVNALKV
ncbi:MAG TPA: YvrJ family protein [Metalysinibacillus jejuensis]|uniref:YvrJ family protein n=1 Tax=Metalysinibacillus jejuensis TaxID=914327 RepID=A0A921T589_9BACL|nr:YvrJ family protein [Metalysinibacillus jejuensis]HJH10804.1 YvrJ family protein [Metalysinibacillus jejuensis]